MNQPEQPMDNPQALEALRMARRVLWDAVMPSDQKESDRREALAAIDVALASQQPEQPSSPLADSSSHAGQPSTALPPLPPEYDKMFVRVGDDNYSLAVLMQEYARSAIEAAQAGMALANIKVSFEEHFGADWEDPAVLPEREIWIAAYSAGQSNLIGDANQWRAILWAREDELYHIIQSAREAARRST